MELAASYSSSRWEYPAAERISYLGQVSILHTFPIGMCGAISASSFSLLESTFLLIGYQYIGGSFPRRLGGAAAERILYIGIYLYTIHRVANSLQSIYS